MVWIMACRLFGVKPLSKPVLGFNEIPQCIHCMIKFVKISMDSSETAVLELCHQTKTFSALLTFCEGKPSVTGGFPSQWPVTWSFDVICVWTDVWVNNQFAGDLNLRRHRAHYYVTVMVYTSLRILRDYRRVTWVWHLLNTIHSSSHRPAKM